MALSNDRVPFSVQGTFDARLGCKSPVYDEACVVGTKGVAWLVARMVAGVVIAIKGRLALT
jgi:hypothetical protein